MLTLGGVSTVFARGGWGMMGVGDPDTVAQHWSEQIAQHASVLGISSDEMKTYWAQGKTLWDIAKEKGIVDADLQTRLKAQKEEQLKESLQTLVDKGVITQAQADARLQFMKENTGKFPAGRIGRHGMRMMW